MTPSMHRRALAPIDGPRHAIALGAQLIKDGQHRGLARVHEGPARDVLGVLQKLFGFGGDHAGSCEGCRWMHGLARPRCKSSCNSLNFSYGDSVLKPAFQRRFLRFSPVSAPFALENGFGYHKPIL